MRTLKAATVERQNWQQQISIAHLTAAKEHDRSFVVTIKITMSLTNQLYKDTLKPRQKCNLSFALTLDSEPSSSKMCG